MDDKHNENRRKLEQGLDPELKGVTLQQLFLSLRVPTLVILATADDYKGNAGAEIKERTDVPLLPLTAAKDTEGNEYLLFKDASAALDPTSAEFVPELYKEALKELQPQIDEARGRVFEYGRTLWGNFSNTIDPVFKEAAANFVKNIPQLIASMRKAMQEAMPGLDWELIEYITDEMEKPENKPLLDKYENMGALMKGPEWPAILEAARQAKAEAENKTLPTLDGEKLKGINYPISKVNKEVWDKARDEVSGQYKLSVDTTPNADPVQVSVNMDALPPEVLRNLSHYDRRVWTAAVSLWVQGCRVVSAANIFYAMGNNSKPNPDQIEKIDRSMYKMGATYIQIDNMNEAASTNYDLFFRDKFYLLKVEGTSAINPANGKVISSAYILPEDEPKLLTFARMRGQVTTISRAVYAAPISQSENGLKLHDFLIDRIITMKREPQYSHKIKLAAVCEYMGTTTKHKDRLKDQIANLLTYFADPNGGNFIAGWRTTTKAEERKEPAGYYIELKAEALPDNSKGKK